MRAVISPDGWAYHTSYGSSLRLCHPLWTPGDEELSRLSGWETRCSIAAASPSDSGGAGRSHVHDRVVINLDLAYLRHVGRSVVLGTLDTLHRCSDIAPFVDRWPSIYGKSALAGCHALP